MDRKYELCLGWKHGAVSGERSENKTEKWNEDSIRSAGFAGSIPLDDFQMRNSLCCAWWVGVGALRTVLDLKELSEGSLIKIKEFQEFIINLFLNYVEKFLEKIRQSTKEPFVTSNLQLVVSMCNLMDCFLSK